MAVVTEENVIDALREVFDPEIPVNVVDLGLVYDVKIEDGNKVSVKMTLTAPGCPLASVVEEDARDKILSVTGAKEADIEIVFEPPWTPERLTDEGRKALGWE